TAELADDLELLLVQPGRPVGAGGRTSSLWERPSASIARTRARCRPAGRPGSGSRHCTQVSVLATGASSHSCQGPSSTLTSTAPTPVAGSHATPPSTSASAGTWAPRRGTSIREASLIGPSLAQPRGTQ